MDGKHQPPYATLRFYRVDPDGRRELFRIQGLYSEARYQEHSPAAAARWDAASRRLFRWLSSALGRRSDWVTSLQVIKLTPAELAAWQPFWEQFPDRIIDRHSQRPLWEKLPVARLRIGLAAEESLVRIAAPLPP